MTLGGVADLRCAVPRAEYAPMGFPLTALLT